MEESETSLEYVYLLREREFIRLKEPCYKIGRTKQKPSDRFSDYPKGSEIIFFCNVSDSVQIEKQMIQIFKRDFQHKKEYGNEYFLGDPNDMIRTILNIVTKTPGIQDLKAENGNLQNEIEKYKQEMASMRNETSQIVSIIREQLDNLCKQPQESKTKTKKQKPQEKQEDIIEPGITSSTEGVTQTLPDIICEIKPKSRKPRPKKSENI